MRQRWILPIVGVTAVSAVAAAGAARALLTPGPKPDVWQSRRGRASRVPVARSGVRVARDDD